MLAPMGVDLISPMPPRARSRARKQQLLDHYGIDPRSDNRMPRKYRRTLDDLLRKPAFPSRHGAPRRLREAGLLAIE